MIFAFLVRILGLPEKQKNHEKFFLGLVWFTVSRWLQKKKSKKQFKLFFCMNFEILNCKGEWVWVVLEITNFYHVHLTPFRNFFSLSLSKFEKKTLIETLWYPFKPKLQEMPFLWLENSFFFFFFK